MTIQALRIPLEPGKFYHLYNRGNNREKLFFQASDYEVFLKKYNHYLDTYVDTYAYCLLPNHFHFLIRVKEEGYESHSEISNQFRRLFISYAFRVNSQQGRKGCLLTRNYRRIEILDETYLSNVVRYIHNNPVKHGYSDSISNYRFSSYKALLHQANPFLMCTEVMNWFGGEQSFLEYHHQVDPETDLNGILYNE